MRRLLRILAATLAVLVIAGWAGLGANRGWTKTQATIDRVDEVTGLSYKETQSTFRPGVELLALGLGLAGAAFASSFFIRQSKTNS